MLVQRLASRVLSTIFFLFCLFLTLDSGLRTQDCFAADTSTYYQFSISGTDNPSVVAKSANKGAVYWRMVGGLISVYQKQDNGLSTNWTQISAVPPSGALKQITFYDAITGQLTSATGVAPNAFSWDQTNFRLGIQTSTPQCVIQIGAGTSGTAGAGCISLFAPDPTAPIGVNAVNLGAGSRATGAGAKAFGVGVFADGPQSTAEGGGSLSAGLNAHGEGTGGGIGDYSHGESFSVATDSGSHAENSSAAGDAGFPSFTVPGGGTHVTVTGQDLTGIMSLSTTARFIFLSGGTNNTLFVADKNISNVVFAAGDTTFDIDSALDDRTGGIFLMTGLAGSAHAEGGGQTLSPFSHVEGTGFVPSGSNAAHAEGNGISLGSNAHSEGNGSQALEHDTHAEGFKSVAFDVDGHAQGNLGFAGAGSSSAEGNGAISTGPGAHAEGQSTAGDSSKRYSCTVSGTTVTIPGLDATADLSGRPTGYFFSLTGGVHNTLFKAQKTISVVVFGGVDTTFTINSALDDRTSCEFVAFNSGSDDAHSEGQNTIASGVASHAGGRLSIAKGDVSFAHGTKAQTGANNGTFIVTDGQNFQTTNDVGDQFKARYQGGFKFVKGGGADNNDGPVDLDLNDQSATFSGSVGAGGAATFTNALIIANDGHFKSTQTMNPVATVDPNAGAGATCAVANATDTAGGITLVTTAAGPAAGAQCSIAFFKAYNVAPICTWAPTDGNAVVFSVTNGAFITTTTTNLVINYVNADAAGHTNTWNYICVETQ